MRERATSLSLSSLPGTAEEDDQPPVQRGPAAAGAHRQGEVGKKYWQGRGYVIISVTSRLCSAANAFKIQTF